MRLIKLSVIYFFTILLSFVFWYFVLRFFSGESGFFEWKWWVKIFYFVISFIYFNQLTKDLTSRYDIK